MKKDERSADIERKVVKEVFKQDNGCLIITFTDKTYIGIYNKGDFTEEGFELGFNIY